MAKVDGYLHDSGKLHFHRLKILIQDLATQERKYFCSDSVALKSYRLATHQNDSSSEEDEEEDVVEIEG